ncbi:MAG: hypothetical protein AAF757_23030 [Cyanobacteria bacterium P01_D01_bin.116]
MKQNTGSSKYINYYNCLILCFFILSFIGILNHEMWRDETQAWLIARDSSTLIDLYQNLKYEGHPGLWHLCLFLIAKLTHNPFAMQFFHILISTAIVYIFVKLSPFNILQKTLFTFGYFPFFEYNLISRNYNLGLLLVFIFCYLFTCKNRNYITLFLTLAFLANTNVYGLIICLCLSTTLIIDTIIKHRKIQYKLNIKHKKNLYIGLLILFFGLGLSFFQLLPVAIQHTAKDIQQNTGKQIFISELELLLIKLKNLAFTIKTIWSSYIPIPNFFEYHFWNKNITSISIILELFALCISFLILIFSVFIFIDKPIVLFFYLSGTLGIFLLTFFKWRGSLRHHGHLFIIFLACIWISKFFEKSYSIPNKFQKVAYYFKKSQKKIITFILLIQMLAGLHAYSMDLIYPFSKSKAAAQFIQKQDLDEAFILGTRDTIVSPISAYIEKKIFYIENNRLGSFFQNPLIKFIKNQSELIDKIDSIVKNNSTKKVLILSYPLNLKQSQINITKIGEFDGSIVADDKYYIYTIKKIN